MIHRNAALRWLVSTALLATCSIAQAGTSLTLRVPDKLLLGTSVTAKVTGARSGEQVHFIQSNAGVGSGPCPRVLDGQCAGIVSPITVLGSATAGRAGRARITSTVTTDASLEGAQACWQAYVVRARRTVLSAPACGELGLDRDGDGVFDLHDVCPGFDDAGPDADADGTPDACEPPEPAGYTDLTWSTRPTAWTFQGRNVRSVLPTDPVGIVWVFHGTHGSSDVVDIPEMQVVLQAMLDRGYGFVAVDADASNGQFDDEHGPAGNADWPYIDALRNELIAGGSFTASTPTFALGFSAGGAFTSWLGHVAPDAGWPLAGLILHNSAGWNATYRGELPPVAIAFVPSVNDEVILLSDVELFYDRHLDDGYDAVLLENEEEDLVPSRFDRSPYIDRAGSERLFDVFVAHGWYDASGHRTYRGDPNQLVDGVLANYKDVTPIRPTKAVMSSVLATHAVNSGHADEEADFLDDHL